MGKIIPLFSSPSSPYPTNLNSLTQEEGVVVSATAATTTPGARTRARARGDEHERAYAMHNYAGDEVRQLSRYYCDIFERRKCPPSILQQIKDALEAGMEAETVALCMDAAVEAAKPSWAYAAAVIRRCIEEGVLTAEAFARRNERHRSRIKKNSEKLPTALNYPQRHYTDAELDALE